MADGPSSRFKPMNGVRKAIKRLMRPAPDSPNASVPDFYCPETLHFTPMEDSESIRILQLWPGVQSQHLKCSLHHIKLSAGHYPYLALSYTWGDWANIESRRYIECDGVKAVVSANLHSAMSRIRERKQSVFLWVDALCINQSTDSDALKERESQVAMMNRIFSQAESVFVDLGDAGEEEMQLLRALRPCRERAHLVTDLKLPCTLSELKQVAVLPGLEHPCWVALTKLLQRQYFRRLWVLQEFAMAKKGCILLGTCRLNDTFLASLLFSSQYFSQLIAELVFKVSQSPHNLDSISNAHLIPDLAPLLPAVQQIAYNLWQFVLNRQERVKAEYYAHALCRFLDESELFDVTDPRDRVYAILGLAAESMQKEATSFKIDYTESLHKLSLRLAIHHIERGDASYALARCIKLTGEGPSWRYALGDKRTEILQGFVRPEGDSDLYQACGDSIVAVEVIEDEQVLRTNALMLDVIINTSDQCEPSTIPQAWPDPASALVRQARWLITLSMWFESISERASCQISPSEFWRAASLDCQGRGDTRWMRATNSPDLDAGLTSFTHEVSRLRNFVDRWPSLEDIPIAELALQLTGFQNLYQAFDSATIRRMALTSDNILCSVPGSTLQRDQIAFICGMPIPFVLRSMGRNIFAIVGLCYVHNMMDGQAFQATTRQVQSILLC